MFLGSCNKHPLSGQGKGKERVEGLVLHKINSRHSSRFDTFDTFGINLQLEMENSDICKFIKRGCIKSVKMISE